MVSFVGAGIASLVFGLSKSYAQAVIGRFVAGVLNGNMVLVRAHLADVTDDSNRARAFSFLPLLWGIGSSVAPLVGGLVRKGWPAVLLWWEFSSADVLVAVALSCSWCAALVPRQYVHNHGKGVVRAVAGRRWLRC